jgi:hypothetical protein
MFRLMRAFLRGLRLALTIFTTSLRLNLRRPIRKWEQLNAKLLLLRLFLSDLFVLSLHVRMRVLHADKTLPACSLTHSCISKQNYINNFCNVTHTL